MKALNCYKKHDYTLHLIIKQNIIKRGKKMDELTVLW